MPRAREHSKELMRAFAPLRMFLSFIGQMPFIIRQKEDGTYSFKFNRSSGTTIFFFLTFCVFTANYLVITFGIMSFVAQVDFFEQKRSFTILVENIERLGEYKNKSVIWENYNIQKYFVFTIVVWSWETVAIVGASYVLLNGHTYVHYANYWNRVVQNMDMNVTAGVRTYLIRELVICLLVVICFLVCAGIPQFEVISGLCDVFANFYLRVFRFSMPQEVIKRDIRSWKYYAYKAPGLFTIIYAYLASRANIMQFVFFNKILINTSRIWNARLSNGLAGAKEKRRGKDKTMVRLDLRLILKDHFALVQLFKMTESIFSRILITYYFLQIANVVLNIYQMATMRFQDPRVDDRQFSTADNIALNLIRFRSEKETQEWSFALQSSGVTLLVVAQAFLFVLLTTRSGAKSYEEAMGGFQILRRNCYLRHCDTKQERNFVHSLIISFAPNNPLHVTAGGYFPINKSLLPGLMGTVAGYFVACYTLKPDQGPFWKQDAEVTTVAPVG